MTHSSASSFSNTPNPVPSCDAWGNIKLGTSSNNTTSMDESGVLSVSRTAAGRHAVNFTSPARFGGGGYVAIFTPEVKDFNLPCLVSKILPTGGATGPGDTAGFQFTTWGFQTPAAGGGTAEQKDFTFGDVYVNFAAFAFKTNTDIRTPVVQNLINSNMRSWQNQQFVSDTTETDPIGYPVYKITPSNSYIYSAPIVSIPTTTPSLKTYTASFYAKAGTTASINLLLGTLSESVSRYYFKVNLNGATGTAVGSSISGPAISNVFTSTGTNNTVSVSDAGGGWRKIVITHRPTSTNNGKLHLYMDTGTVTSNKYFFASSPQIQEGSQATEFIPSGSAAPVAGNQDVNKTLVPGACGFGISGGTYSSHLPALMSKRTATAYGTIVIPPRKNDVYAPVSAYIENGYGVSGVSAGANSTFDVLFSTPLTNANYCVILSAENESKITSIGSDYGEILEHSMLLVDRSYKTVNGFRAVALKQNSTNNSWYRASVRYQGGYTERIHFMVFGGGTYGQA
jgi:hypothetical protein